jgi:type IV secretory pathway VirB4 component
MDTAPLSTAFPFISFDLSSNEGILYGVNRHNNSLVLFDRFSLENANMVCFAKSGSGKSYAIKLEILRYLMQGVDVIIIDPENEYEFLADAVGGEFFKISLTSQNHVNPFDLPVPGPDDNPDDVLRSNIINLVGLLRIMLGGLSPEEDSILDEALTETYAVRDITAQSDPKTWQNNIPLMSDFEEILESMTGTESLVKRIKKFTKGTFADFFNQQTNISLNKSFIVFGIRDMEESLRPIALYIIMRYVWNIVRTNLKKRILVIDEAWWLMQSEDGASFLFGLVKRGRKYWLGVTTITQDVADFMKSDYGKAIITNSSLQLLMKQSTASIDLIQKAFNLTEQEKYLLIEAAVGEGLFFAGRKHVAIAVVASQKENEIISTRPDEVLKMREAKKRISEAENI